MDFEAEEVVRLRGEILRFVLQQLKESAARGELRGAADELAGPIEAAVQRAMAKAGAGSGGAGARLGDVEVNRIARAVAAQLGGRARAAPAAPDDTATDEEPAQEFSIHASPEPARSRRRSRASMEQLLALVVALVLGIAIGIGIDRMLAPSEDQAMVGSESTQIIQEPQTAATSDADLRKVEGPQGGSATPAAPKGQQ